MNQLASNITSIAITWLERQCYETTQNRGKCIDDIHEQYSSDWIEKNTNEAYCAEFVSVVLARAFQNCGSSTPIYTALAKQILNDGLAKGFVVDRKPRPGAVFYKKSTAAGSSGHVGIVVEVLDGDRFNTVEGNATDPATGKEGVVSIQRSIKADSSLRIIHVEDALGDSGGVVIAGVPKPMIAIMVMLALGYIWENRKSFA